MKLLNFPSKVDLGNWDANGTYIQCEAPKIAKLVYKPQ